VLLPGLMPLAVAVIGMAFLGERPDRWRKAGMVAILAGGGILLAGNLGVDGLGWISFTILPIGATLWAVYTHAFRRSGLDAFEGAALICVWSTILNLAALPFVGTQFLTAPLGEIALQSVTQGLLSGLVATLLYGTAVRALGGTQAAAYTAITPVAAAIGGAVLLAEPLGISILVAALVTGFGVLLSTGLLSRRQHAG
jgi:drug/metabolite transporter (DMT)-like permease